MQITQARLHQDRWGGLADGRPRSPKFLRRPPNAPSPRSPFYEQLASDEFLFPYDEIPLRVRGADRQRPPQPGRSQDLAHRPQPPRPERQDPRRQSPRRRPARGSGRRPAKPWPSPASAARSIPSCAASTAPGCITRSSTAKAGGAWKALSPRSFKLPNARLQSGGKVQAVFIGDDHAFDDADVAVTADLKATKITGDFFCDFLRNLKTNVVLASGRTPWPTWPTPCPSIKTIRQILLTRTPTCSLNLGDSTGIGAEYRWENWGLPYQNLTAANYDYIARTLWLRMRKAYSGLTPNMPTLTVLGNHDGEEGYNPARAYAKSWRQKLLPHPTPPRIPRAAIRTAIITPSPGARTSRTATASNSSSST